jgi:hypothetical protein
MYVRKHSVLVGQPSISSILSPLDFYIWGLSITKCIHLQLEVKRHLTTHSCCLSNIRNFPGTCDSVRQSVIIHDDACFGSGGGHCERLL